MNTDSLLESMPHLIKDIKNKTITINDKRSHVPKEYECRSSAVKDICNEMLYNNPEVKRNQRS